MMNCIIHVDVVTFFNISLQPISRNSYVCTSKFMPGISLREL